MLEVPSHLVPHLSCSQLLNVSSHLSTPLSCHVVPVLENQHELAIIKIGNCHPNGVINDISVDGHKLLLSHGVVMALKLVVLNLNCSSKVLSTSSFPMNSFDVVRLSLIEADPVTKLFVVGGPSGVPISLSSVSS